MKISPMLLLAELHDFHEKGLPRGVSTGWKSLDPYYTVRTGEWSLVTGIPGHGKSEWLDDLMIHLATKHGFIFRIFSPENQPHALHAAKLIEKYTGKPFDRGPTERLTFDEVTKATEWLNNHFRFVKPENDDFTLQSILEECGDERVSVKKGVVIDPWNELDHRRPSNFSETEYISSSLSTMRQWARDWDTHVWLVAHPTKLQKDAKGNYPVPTPYDVSGSAHWRNKADNCIAIWRDVMGESSDVEIHIQKVRFKTVGKPGKAVLRYNRVTGQYSEQIASVSKLAQYKERIEIRMPYVDI